MKTADEWTKASTIAYSKSAKEAQRAKIAADVDAYLAAGGQIRQVEGFTEVSIPTFISGYSIEDMRSRSRKGARKSQQVLAAAKVKV